MIPTPILVKALLSAVLGIGTLPLVTGVNVPKKETGKVDFVGYLKLNWWKVLAAASAIVVIMTQLNIFKKR